MIKVEIFKMKDFEFLNDKSHTSISGGIATHDLYDCGGFKANSIKEAIMRIIAEYGMPFIFDDRLELNISESETMSFYLTEFVETRIEMVDVKELFPTIEEY